MIKRFSVVMIYISVNVNVNTEIAKNNTEKSNIKIAIITSYQEDQFHSEIFMIF